jgi:hypothetical protein
MKTSDERVLLFQTTTKPKTKNKEEDRERSQRSTNFATSQRKKKKFGPFLDLCVSSLRRGHANLLCIVPILSDVPKDDPLCSASRYKLIFTVVTQRCGTRLQYALNWVGARLKLGLESYLSYPGPNT